LLQIILFHILRIEHLTAPLIESHITYMTQEKSISMGCSFLVYGLQKDIFGIFFV